MDQTRLDAIRARCEAATPGPWRTKETPDYTEVWDNDSWAKGFRPLALVGSSPEDAEFIAHAREDVPYLLDRVAALEASAVEREDYIMRLLSSNIKLVNQCNKQMRHTVRARKQRDAWRARAEAAQKAIENLMESAYNGDRGMCYMCNKEAACDQAIKDTEYAECAPEWRGPNTTIATQQPDQGGKDYT